MLNIIDHVPDGLLAADARHLHEVLAGPTLIHLPGRRPEPLFVSVLLHGNEDTGLTAVQALWRKYQGRELPRALSVFIGNVAAARHGMRRLEGQPDYNRIWPGGEAGQTPEHAMMGQVVAEMRARGVFASVDVHNNTGLNPHYACVNRIDQRFFHLATLFSRTVVYFIRPLGVQTAAFAELCPAVTLECGQPGQAYGVEHVLDYLEACLHLAEIPTHPVAEHDMDLFHTVATVTVPAAVDFGFGDAAADIRFVGDLDHLNFRELPAGTLLGWLRPDGGVRLEVRDEQGREVGADFFRWDHGEIRTARPLMPSMLTLDQRVIRQDCLCYLMERYPLAGA
ncbi:MAG: M14 family metallopeptidase [Pseudomonadota bacterium]|uniref:M14 family metallopeptidase n=1 Tax=Thermithiobacillus tepidarius TaxID=929 RepID=UPI0003F6A58B|nr:M14 family metallopeptidase [Thermithiobacillus tepidarius]